APQFVSIERRLGQNIGQHIEREEYVCLEHACKIAGRFNTGRCIEISAHSLDCLRDLPCGAAPGALEGHVFEQMRDSVLVRLLVAAARADPHSEGCRFKMRYSIGDHRQARRKASYFNTHAAAPSREARDTDVTYRSTAV